MPRPSPAIRSKPILVSIGTTRPGGGGPIPHSLAGKQPPLHGTSPGPQTGLSCPKAKLTENHNAISRRILFIVKLKIGLGKLNVSQLLVGFKIFRLKGCLNDKLHHIFCRNNNTQNLGLTPNI